MTIKFSVDGTTAVIVIDRPEAMNAIDPQDNHALLVAFEEFESRVDCLVGVVTGAGTASFCAGADLKRLIPERRARALEGKRGGTSFGGITRDFRPAKPLIAAVNGYCLAGGLELALACDIRICSTNATFGLSEVRWGLIPGSGGTQRLPRAISAALAMQMILTGEPIDSATALRAGLVSRVLAPADLMSEALRLASLISANGPVAVRAAKRAIVGGLDQSLDDGLRLEQEIFRDVVISSDAEEGFQAFAEKRRPAFKGI